MYEIKITIIASELCAIPSESTHRLILKEDESVTLENLRGMLIFKRQTEEVFDCPEGEW